MSDGPHCSLPMRPGWKRLAECADHAAFAPEDLGGELIPALEQDCRADLSPEFLNAFRGVYARHENSLFGDQLAPDIQTLEQIAGPGIARILLDFAIQLAERGDTKPDAAI